MPGKTGSVPPSQKVAERLGLLLKLHGVSQRQLARGIGATDAAVSQWINAKAAISARSGKSIAEFLGEDYEFVMGLSDRGSKGLGAFLSDLGPDRLSQLVALEGREARAFLALVDKFLREKSDADSVG